MAVEENKVVVRRFIDEIFVKGNGDAVDKLATSDFTPHSWPSVPPGADSLKQAVKRVSAGLAGVSMKIEDMISEDDKVAVRLTAHATHQGDFMGLRATGKSYTISETHIFHMRDGKVAEHWRDADMLGRMRQLGALPEPPKK
jgi:predicted ester cyclase